MSIDIHVRVKSAGLTLPITRHGSRPNFGITSLLGGYAQKRDQQDKVVLSDINFELNNGDRLGLIGKNGAGKTTLLKLIGGVYLLKKEQLRHPEIF